MSDMLNLFFRIILRSPCLILLIMFSVTSSSHAEIIAYPSPPGLTTSDDFTVEINGQIVWTEKLESNMDLTSLPSWFTSTPYTKLPQQVNIVNFSCSEPISVTITVREPIVSYVIRPKSRGIQAQKEGSTLSFRLPGPCKLYIEINDFAALCFFANPPEDNPPEPDDNQVIFFGPGVHTPGMMTLNDNETLYIAGGAVVYGAITGEPNNARVLGRGILDGSYKHRLVQLTNSSNVEFNGVILRNGRGWQNTLINCTDITYRNVKVISFGNSGDGINPLGSNNVTIEDCFLRCTDDCIAVKAPDEKHGIDGINIINNIMIGYAFSDGLTIGFETNGPEIKNVTVKNCDIIISRGGSRVDGHSAFSIICDGPALISNIRFENIRVEENMLKLFELHITDGTQYGVNPPGHIRGVYLKDIQWEVEKPIILNGFDSQHIVEDVTFDNCTVAGKLLTTTHDAPFKMNEFVKDVKFK